MTLRVYRATRFDTYYLLGLILLSVSAQLLTGDFSMAVIESVPLWEVYLSTSLLLAATAITLIGVVWRGTNLVGLQIEQVGRVSLFFPSLGYGAALIWYAQLHAAVSAALLLWLAVSCLLRAHEIHVALKHHYEALIERVEEQT